ncbi:hypothetical protein [Magnetococcus sp. PR-3]|uniref:hypothetical protein n=1 Tax=Magnetococcus sp. PR-3 TaxID=3120355 RepID=UPI002FCDE57B
MTHEDLVLYAKRYLLKKKRIHVVITEQFIITTEKPDAMGYTTGQTYLIECKATRSDFLADAKKKFRQEPELGMGSYRFYLCPAGLIQKHELPDGWGLLWVEDNGRIKTLKANGNMSAPFQNRKNTSAEHQLLLAYTKRLVKAYGVHEAGELTPIEKLHEEISRLKHHIKLLEHGSMHQPQGVR